MESFADIVLWLESTETKNPKYHKSFVEITSNWTNSVQAEGRQKLRSNKTLFIDSGVQ